MFMTAKEQGHLGEYSKLELVGILIVPNILKQLGSGILCNFKCTLCCIIQDEGLTIQF